MAEPQARYMITGTYDICLTIESWSQDMSQQTLQIPFMLRAATMFVISLSRQCCRKWAFRRPGATKTPRHFGSAPLNKLRTCDEIPNDAFPFKLEFVFGPKCKPPHSLESLQKLQRSLVRGPLFGLPASLKRCAACSSFPRCKLKMACLASFCMSAAPLQAPSNPCVTSHDGSCAPLAVRMFCQGLRCMRQW